MIATDPSELLCVGIEIGGTKLQLGLGDATGRFLQLERRAVDPARGAAGIRFQVKEAIPILLEKAGRPGRAVEAVGIGFGGPVDTDRGVVLESHQIEGWTGFPINQWVRDELGVDRVALQNDADTAGLGEALAGAGIGHSPILYITVGSGIGGGLIIHGQIYRGSGGGATEIGHLWVHPAGEPPTKLEHAASGWGIARCARRWLAETDERSLLRDHSGGIDAVTGLDVSTAAQKGDPLANRVLARARAAMTEALSAAVTLLAPRRIILGGGVSLMPAELWIDPIREGMDDWVFPQFRGTFDLVPAALGEEVVVHGALALARGLLTVRP